jgi:hypothetical protein
MHSHGAERCSRRVAGCRGDVLPAEAEGKGQDDIAGSADGFGKVFIAAVLKPTDFFAEFRPVALIKAPRRGRERFPCRLRHAQLGLGEENVERHNLGVGVTKYVEKLGEFLPWQRPAA